MPTPLRNVRIDDELWQAAQAKVVDEGIPGVSWAIRALLEDWVYGGVTELHPEAEPTAVNED
jgi:hypothetical protein